MLMVFFLKTTLCLAISYEAVASVTGNYFYAGCFGDKNERRALLVQYADFTGQQNIVQKCARKAQELGYQVFGVQYFGQCWAGNSETFALYGYSKLCTNGIGGAWTNAVYFFNGNYFYAGCFGDKNERRALPVEYADFTGQQNIVQKCAKKAQELGYQVFGVQYFGQCWAGNTETFAIHGYSKLCTNGIGGGWTNAVYFFNVDYSYVGCFKDNATRRVMPSLIGRYTHQGTEIGGCANRARALGYKVFGIQNGIECWSGAKAHLTYAKYKYHTNCKQGKGGHSSNAVYVFNPDDCSSPKCDKPLGVEDGRIPDSAITSSSDFDTDHKASNGRLNFQKENKRRGAWSAGKNDVHQWIQVDFNQTMAVKRVSTQGRPGQPQWVISYTLSYSLDGVLRFVPFANNQIFKGNNDQNSIVINAIDPWIKAKSVRLHPKTWRQHISMRLEYYGSKTDPIAPTRCLSALGMQNGLIPDKHITASSNLNTAANGRLHFKTGNGRTGGWTSLRKDDKQFFQVEFANVVNITGIATQGREDEDQWVISYTLSYSFDNINFKPYGFNGNVKRFDANRDRNTVRGHEFSVPIETRYIRLHPLLWHRNISLRVEYYGCYKDFTTPTTFQTEIIGDSTTAPNEKNPESLKADVRVSAFPFLCALVGLLVLLLVVLFVVAWRFRRASRMQDREIAIQDSNPQPEENRPKANVLPRDEDNHQVNGFRNQQHEHINRKESGAYEALNFSSPEYIATEPEYQDMTMNGNEKIYLEMIG